MVSRAVIVTGGGQGIGRAACLAFARDAAAIAVADLDAEHGQAVVEEIAAAGGTAAFVATDVSDEEQVRALVDAVIERWGRLDVLVNNAGLYAQADAVETSLETWHRVIAVNLTGAFICTKYAVPAMADGGVIVNVASEAGLIGIAGQAAYNVSKGGVISLTKSCAVDFAERGVRVNAVCPGTTFTPLVQQALDRSDDPAAALRALEQVRPLGRLGTPEEIAAAIVFAASPEASYMTGAVISIDGGNTAR
jgi:NAD(P)-dependent dehydrogenase (short-subunit alcohol dehydrogenase family)